MNPYRSQLWRAYRAKCIKAADGLCQRCGRGKPEVILQVHHPTYTLGKQPWEYPIEHCEVLCRGCHAEEHGLIMPRDGWMILDSDLERNEPSDAVPCGNPKCERDVTWHVTIYHPDWGELIVGSECAENLSLGSEWKALKSYHRRMKAFIASPRWVPTPKGWRIDERSYSALVFRQHAVFKIKISKGTEEKWFDSTFATTEAAKGEVFRMIEQKKPRGETNGGS